MFQCPFGLQRVSQISGNGIRCRSVNHYFLAQSAFRRINRVLDVVVIVVQCSVLLNLPTYINRADVGVVFFAAAATSFPVRATVRA